MSFKTHVLGSLVLATALKVIIGSYGQYYIRANSFGPTNASRFMDHTGLKHVHGIGTAVAEFAFDARSPLVVAPVVFKGQTFLFLIDTGSSVNMFDIRMKPFMGQTRGFAKLMTGDNILEVERFDAPDAYLGSLSLKSDEKVICCDLFPLREGSGLEIYGVLGMSTLKAMVLIIDSSNKKVQFVQPGSGIDIAGYNKVRVKFNSLRLPVVDITLPDVSSNILIVKTVERGVVLDTGYEGDLTVGSKDFKNMLENGMKILGRELVADLKGRSWRRIVNLNTSQLCGIDLESIKTAESFSKELVADLKGRSLRRIVNHNAAQLCDIDLKSIKTAESVNGDSRIGLGLLRRFDIIVDFAEGFLYLKKHETILKRD